MQISNNAPFQVISRRELQPFRRELKGDSELRLCGKRIQMHCDTDGDKSITEREWDACLGVKEGEIQATAGAFWPNPVIKAGSE